MADGFIVRKGTGVQSTSVPQFNLISLNYRKITFTITNTDTSTVQLFWEFEDTTPDANTFILNSNETSAVLEVDNLIGNTEYSLFAFAVAEGKSGSQITNFTFTTALPDVPTINITEINTDLVRFTLTNNTIDSATVFYDLTGDLNTSSVTVAGNATSSVITIENLSENEPYIIFSKLVINAIISNTVQSPFTALQIVEIVATGGDVVDTYELNGNFYKYHQFNSSETFSVSSIGTGVFNELEYLIIGGGGALSSGSNGGAGGAGGYRSSVKGELSGRNSVAEPTVFAAQTNYSIAVGGGGGTSSAFGIVSLAGGTGGAYARNGASGGSGGGGGGSDVSPCGSGSTGGGGGATGQGFNGGSGGCTLSDGFAWRRGGGGGGAGGNGGGCRCAELQMGNGGVGLASFITGTEVFRARGQGGNTTTPLGSGPNSGGGGSQSGVVIIRYRLKEV